MDGCGSWNVLLVRLSGMYDAMELNSSLHVRKAFVSKSLQEDYLADRLCCLS